MGIAEVLPKYRALKRRINQSAEAALAANPAALITIDSPDFCLRVARLVKAARPDTKTIHYVAPSVWAWRPGRAAKMARVIDHVLALLPFEPPYMTAAGMTCDFVGHPVTAEPIATAAASTSLPPDPRHRGRCPPHRHTPRLAARRNIPPDPALRCHPAPDRRPTPRPARDPAHPRPSRRYRPTQLTQDWPGQPVILTAPDLPTRTAAFAAADAALAASGTVSLELAAQNCPMVIAYDMAPLTLWLMRRMARIDTVTLVNLVSDTRSVPEFIGTDCRPEKIAPALLALLAEWPRRADRGHGRDHAAPWPRRPPTRPARRIIGAGPAFSALACSFILAEILRGSRKATGAAPPLERPFASAWGQDPLILCCWPDSGSARRLTNEQPFLADRRADGPPSAVLPKEPWQARVSMIRCPATVCLQTVRGGAY